MFLLSFLSLILGEFDLFAKKFGLCPYPFLIYQLILSFLFSFSFFRFFFSLCRIACDDDLLWKRLCRQLLPYFREEDVKNTFKEHLVHFYTSADMVVSVPMWLEK